MTFFQPDYGFKETKCNVIHGKIEDAICDPLIGYKYDDAQNDLTWSGKLDRKVYCQ